VNVGDIDGDRFGGRCVLWWILASANALLVTRDWLVGYAADSGKGAAITSQLVRGGGGVSVNKSFPATLVFMRARCWCACRGVCADGLAGPQMSLSTGHAAGQMSPERTPTEPMPMSAELVLANLRELPHEQRMEVAVACGPLAVHAGQDGKVNGLNVPMHIDPALAAHLIADPEACARFVGGLDGATIPVNCLHLITVISVVRGVPIIVLEVIRAAHRKATSFVTDAISVHVHEVNRDGGRVICVCSDGDSTCKSWGKPMMCWRIRW
jgi:hypothetical protein